MRLAETFLLTCTVALSMPASAASQQVPDTAYRFQPISPAAFQPAAGPVVCVDAAHRNAHSLDGGYEAFGRLLTQDGYRVRPVRDAFDGAVLSGCAVLVVANAGRAEGRPPPPYPHPPALTAPELDALFAWVRGGGALLLVVDHPPYPGAVSGVASLFGFQLFDGYAGPSRALPTSVMVFGDLDEDDLRRTTEAHGIPYETFRTGMGDPGTLADHVIVRGRTPAERVSRVVTFTGSAFFPAGDVEPLLVLGPEAAGVVIVGGNAPEAAPEEYPMFPLEGWLVGGVRRLAAGRVAVLAEAAMCSAQLAGRQRIPMGMNMPFASQNAQFCLNLVHWLTGLLG